MGAWQPGYPPGQRQFASLFQRQPLRLEGGEPFGPITLAYESWGQPNRERSNGVLLLHGFSGDSHAAGPREPGHPTAGWWHQRWRQSVIQTDRNSRDHQQGCTGQETERPADTRRKLIDHRRQLRNA